MTVVKDVPKKTWKDSVIHVLKMYRGKYILWVVALMNDNASFKDAEIQKVSLFGPEYLNTREYAWKNLKIAINDMNISFHQQIIKKLTREK